MNHCRFSRPAAVAVLVLAAACRDDRKEEPSPPVTPSSTVSVEAVPALSKTNWKTDAGPVLLAATEQNGDSGVIILPEITDSVMHLDSVPDAQIVGVPMDLFGRAGKVGTASVTLVRQTRGGECRAWPAASVTRPAAAGWNIGFAAGKVEAIALDSLEGLSRTDSAATAVALSRLAATLPASPDRAFRGLPFRVRNAYAFEEGTTRILVGDIVRNINQEANPRVEHLLLIAERAKGDSAYALAYFTRSAGREEVAQVTEILAAVRTGAPRRPLLVVSLVYGEGGKFGIFERVSAARWKMIWKSAYTGC